MPNVPVNNIARLEILRVRSKSFKSGIIVCFLLYTSALISVTNVVIFYKMKATGNFYFCCWTSIAHGDLSMHCILPQKTN